VKTSGQTEDGVVPGAGTGVVTPQPVAGCRVDGLIEAATNGRILVEDEVLRLVDALQYTAEAAAVANATTDERRRTVAEAVWTFAPEILRGATRYPSLLPEAVAVLVRVARHWPGVVLAGLNEQFRTGDPEARAAALEVLDVTGLRGPHHLDAMLAGFRDDPSPLGAAAHLLGSLAAEHPKYVLKALTRVLRREPDLWDALARAVGPHATPSLADALEDLSRRRGPVRMFANEARFRHT
jgi:hypothetical protein